MSPEFLSRTRSWNPEIRPRQQNRIINNLENNFTMKKMSQLTISQLLAGYWNLRGKMGQLKAKRLHKCSQLLLPLHYLKLKR